MFPRYLTDFNLKEIKKTRTKFLIIGSGISGLYASLTLAQKGSVTILTKKTPQDCNTEYAQGGIAAAIAEDDTEESHFKDTVNAGAGLCNPEAVKMLVKEGKERIKDLLKLGVEFDWNRDQPALTREGGHSCRRILHAGGDATGKEIRTTLTSEVLSRANITLEESKFAIDILTCKQKKSDQQEAVITDKRARGVLVYNQQNDTLEAFLADAVILASGGLGQLFFNTSNPRVSTGDGIAMAYRAGAEVMDMELIQFHPTTLPGARDDSNFLISEAVRGEGGLLRDVHNQRFMPEFHEMAELAPRDVVARSIYQQMQKTDADQVFLDVTNMDRAFIKERFPTIYKTCLERGVDPGKNYIPVVPAAHYFMGGIKTNTYGETSLKGLFACGEAAAFGLHGANRLASNSLLEGLVFSKRTAVRVIDYTLDDNDKSDDINFNIDSISQKYSSVSQENNLNKLKSQIKDIMDENTGIIRTGEGLKSNLSKITKWQKNLPDKCQNLSQKNFETQNLLLLSFLINKAAYIRTESRGAHFRRDYPESKDKWRKHIVFGKNYGWREQNIEFK